eukprot:3018214-Prymnesium_polylepis.1
MKASPRFYRRSCVHHDDDATSLRLTRQCFDECFNFCNVVVDAICQGKHPAVHPPVVPHACPRSLRLTSMDAIFLRGA